MQNQQLIESLQSHIVNISENLLIEEIIDTLREFLNTYSLKKLGIKIKDWREDYKLGNPSRLFISIENLDYYVTIIETYIYTDFVEGTLSIEIPSNKRRNNLEDLKKDFNFKYRTPQELKNKLVKIVCYWVVNRWKELIKDDFDLLRNRAQEANKKDFVSQVADLLRKNEDPKFGYADNLVLHALDLMIRGQGFNVNYGNIPDTNKTILQIIATSLKNEPVKFNLLNKYVNLVKRIVDTLINHQIKILLKKKPDLIEEKDKTDLVRFAREEARVPWEQIILFGDSQEAEDWINFCSIIGEEFPQVLQLIDTPTSKTFLKGIKNSKYVSIMLTLINRIYEDEFFR